MKIHEFQAKEIFKRFNIPIQDGYVTSYANEIEATIDRVIKDFNSLAVVVKAQIHAGGRGKGGGVKFCVNKTEAIEKARNILGMNLVTPQTGEKGTEVKKIMIAQAINIKQEYYVAITLDRSVNKNVFMVSQSGGMEIEKVAVETPDKILKEWIDPGFGLFPFQARNLAYALGLTGKAFSTAVKIFLSLDRCYRDQDAGLMEINPLVLIEEGDILALDGKINIDDNSLYRQKSILAMRDLNEENPAEVEAQKYNLNFIKLDGNVGCMVNGAGLAMATMDIIKFKGGEPANFLDVGGNANLDTVKNAFKIILSDSNVKAILINIFGGIVRCDRVAKGIVQASKELGFNIPVVVRLAGTNVVVAQNIIYDSGINITLVKTLEEGAEKVIKLLA